MLQIRKYSIFLANHRSSIKKKGIIPVDFFSQSDRHY
jgi:hypothetical protein